MENFAENTFIHFSTTPIPSYLLNYVLSSADIGLVLYDKDIVQESNNGSTGGKIASYLINGLPLIVGNLPSFKSYEEEGIGHFWDGISDIDKLINKALLDITAMRHNINKYYARHFNYSTFFETFFIEFDKAISRKWFKW